MAHESFAQDVFSALVKLADAAEGGQVSVTDLSGALMIQTGAKHKRMLNTLSDMKKAGKVVRVGQGLYTPAKAKGEQNPEIREVMWRVLRMRRRVTVDDLVEMSGASVKYATDWLRMLEGREVVRRVGNDLVWQLIHDTVEMPVDTDNAARLRALRKKKKQQALADLAAAQTLIGKAHQAIQEMED